jgi:EAL domain-containing protein (putative c-di-GMP-specific phosphodiesterase class I)
MFTELSTQVQEQARKAYQQFKQDPTVSNTNEFVRQVQQLAEKLNMPLAIEQIERQTAQSGLPQSTDCPTAVTS